MPRVSPRGNDSENFNCNLAMKEASICTFFSLLEAGTLNQHILRLHTLHRVALRFSPRSKSHVHPLGIIMVTVVNTSGCVQYAKSCTMTPDSSCWDICALSGLGVLKTVTLTHITPLHPLFPPNVCTTFWCYKSKSRFYPRLQAVTILSTIHMVQVLLLRAVYIHFRMPSRSVTSQDRKV
jgi:hypothetical protein